MKWKIGNVTITKVVELEAPGISFIVPMATAENCQDIAWLHPHFVNHKGEPTASVHSLMVESDGARILVDTCIGNDKTLDFEFWSNRSGPFLNDLAKAGFPAESIDTVLCTHLHPDHVGWNTQLGDGKWAPTFASAKYLFGRQEFEYWSKVQEKHPQSFLTESVMPIVDADQHTLVETDHKITPEVWLEPTPGHTPGHCSVHIASAGEEAVITGDIMHHPCQMCHPEWTANPDFDKQQAIDTRTKFMQTYSDTPTLVIGTHFSGPTAGRIVADGDTWRLEV